MHALHHMLCLTYADYGFCGQLSRTPYRVAVNEVHSAVSLSSDLTSFKSHLQDSRQGQLCGSVRSSVLGASVD